MSQLMDHLVLVVPGILPLSPLLASFGYQGAGKRTGSFIDCGMSDGVCDGLSAIVSTCCATANDVCDDACSGQSAVLGARADCKALRR